MSSSRRSVYGVWGQGSMGSFAKEQRFGWRAKGARSILNMLVWNVKAHPGLADRHESVTPWLVSEKLQGSVYKRAFVLLLIFESSSGSATSTAYSPGSWYAFKTENSSLKRRWQKKTKNKPWLRCLCARGPALAEQGNWEKSTVQSLLCLCQ